MFKMLTFVKELQVIFYFNMLFLLAIFYLNNDFH